MLFYILVLLLYTIIVQYPFSFFVYRRKIRWFILYSIIYSILFSFFLLPDWEVYIYIVLSLFFCLLPNKLWYILYIAIYTIIVIHSFLFSFCRAESWYNCWYNCCYNCVIFYTHIYVIILVISYVINYNINYHILMLHFIL